MAVRDEFVDVNSMIVFTRLSIVSFFAVAAMARVSNDYPSCSAMSLRTCCSVLLMATSAFSVRLVLPVVSLLSSLTSLSAARKYFFGWIPLAVSGGLLLSHKVFYVDEPRDSEASLHLKYHFGFADGYFAVGR